MSSDMKIEGYGCEVTLLGEIERLALGGLGLDPDEPDHRIEWDGDDLLWMNSCGSYTRCAAWDYGKVWAFQILALLRSQRDATVSLDTALSALILNEIEYARGEIKLGSTLTRVMDRYEDKEAVVSVFVTTSLKAPEA